MQPRTGSPSEAPGASERLSGMVVYGSRSSYFTGKFEAALRYREIPYEFRPMDLRHYGWVVPRRLGAAQLPAVRLPDGRWMSDTTPMIAWLETQVSAHPLMPSDPVLRTAALLIEDYADEWLWRPAMHYRWSFDVDSRLAGTRLARELLDVPLPLAFRRAYISRRQRRLFVRGDGVEERTRAHVEGSVARLLANVEGPLRRREFLLGARPTIADIGLMGPVWRHLVHDPTPAALLQEEAPATFAWAARMWAARGSKLAGRELAGAFPEDLLALLREIGETHLEALAANALAHSARAAHHDLTVQGVTYRGVPTSAYRVWCLEQLRRRVRELEPGAARTVRELLELTGCWEPLWRVQRLQSGHDPGGVAPFCKATRMVRDR